MKESTGLSYFHARLNLVHAVVGNAKPISFIFDRFALGGPGRFIITIIFRPIKERAKPWLHQKHLATCSPSRENRALH
jgi:hypothetical protein